MTGLPADACSFWRRHVGRDTDENGFGYNPYSHYTQEQHETLEAARDAEDKADPMCGRCAACLEIKSDARESAFGEPEGDDTSSYDDDCVICQNEGAHDTSDRPHVVERQE